jgi:hypothetical protein
MERLQHEHALELAKVSQEKADRLQEAEAQQVDLKTKIDDSERQIVKLRARVSELEEKQRWPAGGNRRPVRARPFVRLGADRDGSITVGVVSVMTLYTEELDGSRLNAEASRNLVHDLLCLGSATLHQSHEATDHALELLSEQVHARAPKSHGCELTVKDLVSIALNWESATAHLGDLLDTQWTSLPALHEAAFVDQLHALRNQRCTAREEEEKRKREDVWIYVTSKCHGMNVGEDVLAQREGWRFNDHGEGTGVVYWWPLDDMKDMSSEKAIEAGLVALPVQRRSAARAEEPMPSPGSPCSPLALPGSTRSIAEAHDFSINVEDSCITDADADADPIASMREAYARVERRLEALGLRSVDVGGGGDCFFRALAAQHPDCAFSPSLHLHARRRTTKVMRLQEERFTDTLVLTSKIRSYADYVDQMSLAGTWVEGEVELLAAAAAFNVNIHIWGEDESHDYRVLAPNPSPETFNVCVVHIKDRHYRVLERLKPKSK